MVPDWSPRDAHVGAAPGHGPAQPSTRGLRPSMVIRVRPAIPIVGRRSAAESAAAVDVAKVRHPDIPVLFR